MKLRYWLCFWGIGLLPGLCRGQMPYIRPLQHTPGLHTSTIYDLYSDPGRGYLYACTDNGVYRFNGRTFFRLPVKGNATPEVLGLSPDRQGRFWCHGFSNTIWIIQNDTLFPLNAEPYIGRENTVLGLFPVEDTLWLATRQAVIGLSLNYLRQHTRIPAPPGKTLETVLADHNGIWGGSGEGGGYFAKIGSQTFRYPTPEGVTYRFLAEKTGAWAMQKWPNGGDLYWFQQGRIQLVQPSPIPSDAILHNLRKVGETLWLCTSQGAYPYRQGAMGHPILPGERVSDMITDYQGHIWIATLDHGLFLMPDPGLDFIPLRQQGGLLQQAREGGLWLSNADGSLDYLDLRSRTNTRHFELPGQSASDFIAENPYENTLYLTHGVLQQGCLVPGYQGRSVAFVQKGWHYAAMYMEASLIVKPGVPIPAFAHSLRQYRIPGTHLRGYTLRPGRFRCLYFDPLRQELWLGGTNRLEVMDSLGHFREIKAPDSQPLEALKIAATPDGKIWLATRQHGLLMAVNGVTQNIPLFPVGQPETIRQLMPTPHALWILTDQAVYEVDSKTQRAKAMSRIARAGIRSVTSLAVVRDSLWLAVPGGLVGLPIAAPASTNEAMVKLQLLFAKLSGIKISSSNYIFNYDKNNLEIGFEAIHFSGETLGFRYRLCHNGQPGEWQLLPETSTHLTLAHLSHGNYTFEIQALNASYMPCSQVVQCRFVINRPFWLQAWFLLLSVGAVLGTGWLLLRMYLTRYRKRQEYRELLTSSQLTALRAQMNPHFLYNALNSLQGMIYSDQTYEAGEYVSKFSQHLRGILEMSGKQSLSIREEVEALRTYLALEQIRFGDDFSAVVKTSDLPDDSLEIPTMIVQPFVENAIKHGLLNKRNNKELTIIFKQIDDTILITIADNGIGRKRSAELNAQRRDKPTSFATHAINSRIALLNAARKRPIQWNTTDLTDPQGHPAGTEVTITIPIESQDATPESPDRGR